ncbi:MAG: BON domain-containing protein [Cardiobacteriaceae bacterium]|nr:BON domain-containing protein [Cardiobacteriaceae bacterium]
MKKTLCLALLASLALQGCAPILIGGAATGAGMIHDRRSAGTVLDDNTAEIAIAAKIGNIPALRDNSHVSVTGYNTEILLTGETINDAVRQQIESLARAQPGVSKVHNHLIVGRPSTFSERGYDAKQTTKVKAALFDVRMPGFDPTRVKVVTEHGITYLMGIVSDQEAHAVTDVASRVSGVRQIVTLFQIR